MKTFHSATEEKTFHSATEEKTFHSVPLDAGGCVSCDHVLLGNGGLVCGIDPWLLEREVTADGARYLACDQHQSGIPPQTAESPPPVPAVGD
jgi:hypothetical protein